MEPESKLEIPVKIKLGSKEHMMRRRIRSPPWPSFQEVLGRPFFGVQLPPAGGSTYAV